MKKYNKFGYVGAMMLAGLVSFSSCSSDDDMADVNPNYNPETGTVKTQFAIAVPYAGKAGRMTDAIVQNQGYNQFRGMSNLRLLPFAASVERTAGPAEHVIKGTTIVLAPLPKGSSEETQLSTSQRKLYKDVDIPRSTSNMLFYAEATTSPEQLIEAADKFANGQLSTNLGGPDVNSAESIEFSLVKCHKTEGYAAAQTKIANALSAIAGADGWKTIADLSTPKEAGKVALKKLYGAFKGLKAGSASMILAAVQDLYTSVSALTGDGTVETEVENIITAIRGAFDVDPNGTLSWKASGFSEVADFPAKFNLPDGSVSLAFADAVKPTFSYNDDAGIVTNPSLKPADLTFPASLYYFVNSDLAVNSQAEVIFPEDITAWIDQSAWSSNNWTTAPVASNTRGIALKQPINYGVARLDMTVKCKTKALPDATQKTPKQIAVDQKGFPVTAVLIGGQPVKVGWDMVANHTTETTNVVYDRIADNQVFAKYDADAASGGVNYTLLLDNTKLANGTSATRDETQPSIYVAVELVNNTGVAFTGAQGIVPAGSKFYLTAQLDPAGQKFDNQGTVKENPSVFMQDYVTKANFTISTLAHAYNTIPDLRTSEMQFGMAVDLKWQAGITFDNVGLGGE